MKRIVSVAAIAALLLSSCGATIPEMSTNFKTTPKLIEQESSPDSLTNIVAGGPLYVGETDSANPTLAAYRKLREKRAAEILKMMEGTRGALNETMEKMPELRGLLGTFLSGIAASADKLRPEQAGMATYALDTIDRLLEATVRTYAAYAELESMARAIEETKVPKEAKSNPVVPMFQYAEYVLLQKLSDAITHELTYLPARAANIVVVIKGNEEIFGKDIQKLAKKFDGQFGKRLGKVSESFQEAVSSQLDLSVGFDSMAAADYAFAMASLEFAKQKLPEIAAQVAQLETGKAVSPEDKDFYESYAGYMQAFTDEMRKGLEGYEPPIFLQDLDRFASSSDLIPAFEGVAYAGVTDWLGKASSALSAGLKGSGKLMYGAATGAAGCVTSPWQCTKDAASTAATVATATAMGAKAAAKLVQKGVGIAADCASIPAILVSNEMHGLYHGSTRREIALRGADQLTRMYKSWDEGKPGSVTLKDGVKNLTALEEGVGAAVESAVGGVLGGVTGAAAYVADKVTPDIVKQAAGDLSDGVDWLGRKATGYSIKEKFTVANASWAVGKLGEMTAGMVTGFGKGIMQLANVESTAGELGEGTANVIFSCIGGLKAVVKASQVAAGLKKMGQELAEKTVNVARQLGAKLEKEGLEGKLDDIARAAADGLDPVKIREKAVLEDQLNRKILQQGLIESQEKGLAQIVGELKDKVGERVFGNWKAAKEGAGDFVSKQFELSMAGMKEAVGEITGKTFKDYADNILGGIADSYVTELVKDKTESLIGEKEKAAIDKAENAGAPWWMMGFDPNDPAVKDAMAKAAAVMEETKKQLAALQEAAKPAPEPKTKEQMQEELMKGVAGDSGMRPDTRVSARGSFSGDYRGSVSLNLIPAGGPVSGTVSTKYGSASISGSVSKDGRLTASVSGSMSYDYYPDGVHAEKRTCSLSASMSGTVGASRAAGSYNGSCAKKGDSGSWVASW